MSSREEIKKKWKNRQLTADTEKSSNNSSMWSRVEARAQASINSRDAIITKQPEKVQSYRNLGNTYKNFSQFNSQPIQDIESKKLKEKGFIQDLENTASTAITSVGKTGKSALYYMQSATLNNSDAYKELSKRNAIIKKKEEDSQSIINGKISSDYKDYSNLKDPILDSLDKSIQKDEEKIQLNIDTTSNRALKKLNELVPSMTQSVVGMGVTAINPALGIAFWQTSAGGDYIRQAKHEGMNDEQAFLYGTIMGSLESGTEWVGGKLTANVSKKIAKDGVISGLKAYGLDIGENFLEETIMEPLQEIVKEATGGEADWNDIGNRMLRSGIDGALTSIIMGGVSAGVGKAQNLFSKIQNGEQITHQEIADTLKEINKSEEIDIENLLKQSFGFVTKNDMELENTNRKLDNIATQLSNEESANIILKKEKEQAKIQNNDISQANQQVIPQEQNQAQNANIEQIKLDSENFARQVDDYVSGNIKSSDFINVSSTPKVLQDIGLPDNQIILKQSKLKTILKESDNPNSNLHGLPVETVKRIPEAISNPLNVLKSSSNENSVVVITDLADKMDRPIIASIEMNYKGQIGNIEFLSNRLTSAYGKNNYDNFMRTEIEKGNLLYDIDEGIIKELPASTRLQLSEGVSSSVDTNNNVSTTNNIIPQNENNMQVQTDITQQRSEKYNKFKQQLAENGLNYDDKRANVMFDLPNKRGIDVEVNAEVFKKADGSINSNINAMYITDAEGNRKIIYNPKANLDTVIEKNTIHEVVHDIEGSKEYKQLNKMVLDKMENTPEFQEAYNSLKEAYSKVTDSEGRILYNKDSAEFEEMIKQEVVADYLGENLGNQEYINELVINELVNGKESRNIAQKIYDAIVNFLDKVTGYKSEEAYLRGLKNKFEKAFNAEYINKGDSSKYSIHTNKDGGKFVKVDVDQNIFEGKSVKEQTRIAQDYILNNFRENGLLKDTEKVNVSRKTANEYTHPKSGLDSETYSSKMKASTELDNLLEISKYITSEADDGRHIFAKDGWDYYETVFKVEDKTYSGWLNIANGKNGKLLYDITNIKERASNYSVKTVSVANSSINSITNSKENVNTTKYSMQENENNNKIKSISDIKNKYKDKTQYLILNENENAISINNMVVKKELRNGGIGQNILNDIIKYANENNKVITLTPTTEFNTQNKLKKWYKENGFVENKGRNTDFTISDTMYKVPSQIENSNKSSFSMQQKIDNPDIRYSQNDNGKWQEFLDKNSMNEGTTTTLGELKLPQNTDNKGNIEHKRVELPTNPDIYEDENVRAFKYATDNIDNIMQDDEAVVPPNVPPDEDLPDTMKYIASKRTKEKTSAKEIKDSFMQKFVNKGHYIDKLAKETGNKELTYKYDRTMNAFNEAQYSIGKEQVNSNGEVVGKSLINIFDDAVQTGISEDILNDYLLNKHNISRDVTGKNIYGGEVTSAQSAKKVKLYEEQYPEIVKFGQEVSKYNENNLKDMTKTGMISEATYNNLRALYGDYVPTYRDITEDRMFEDNRVGGNVLGRAVKSNKTILAPKEAMAEQTLAIKKAIRVNELGVELYKTLGKDTEIFSGIEFDNVAMESLQGDVIQKAEDGSNIFTIFMNGEMAQFKISDDIYTAFQKDTLSNRIRNDKLAKAILTPVEKVSKAQRDLLTTYSIGFAFNNPIKDIQDAVINTKYSVPQFAKNYTKALYQLGTKGDIYKTYIRNGGGSNTYFDYTKGILPQKTNAIKSFLEKVKGVNEVLEQAPRLAEYMSTIENGGTVSEALYNSAEITTNFKRGGEITKVANRYGANFLNASVQGLDKQIRNITGQNGIKGYANIIIRGTLLGVAPAVINHLLLEDDEDYEDLPDYIKDGYYLIPSEDGKFVRIPKGRVVATLGTVSRNFTELAEGEQDVIETLENSASAIVDNLAPNNPFKENLFAPLFQAKNNKAWHGGAIEGTRLQNITDVAKKTDERTSEIANKISDMFNSNGITRYIQDKLGLSPKKIDYVLDQYSGGIGDVILPKFTPYAENNILEDKFTTDVVLKNKNVETFFAELQNVEKVKKTEFATDTDKLKYKYLSTISEDVSDLYAEKRDIQNSKISDKEKKEQVREIQKKINDMVKGALNTLEEANINSSTANFGEIEYIKNKDGEWERLKEDEKVEGLSTKTYSRYKTDISKETEQKRKIEGEDAKLNNKEKINLIQKNTYTEEERRTIYANYIGKDDDTYNTLSKLQDGQTNIDAYLDYKLQDFTGDEDTSSNIVGKKVSGSSKNKTMEYLRKSSLTDIEKIYIVGTKYANELNESQKEYIFNLVNKKITDEKELNKVLKKFEDLEQHKNGEWHWK